MPVGREIGKALAGFWNGWLLVPVGMLLGYFVVSAEPAVYVLNKQVEHMSAGAVSASTMKKGLCIGVCAALGFSMLRIVLGFNVMWLLLPGYAAALVLIDFYAQVVHGYRVRLRRRRQRSHGFLICAAHGNRSVLRACADGDYDIGVRMRGARSAGAAHQYSDFGAL